MTKTKPTGQHREKRLTAATIRHLKEPGFYGDGHGLYLKVDTSGDGVDAPRRHRCAKVEVLNTT